MSFEFEILIDDELYKVIDNTYDYLLKTEKLLSITNDFENGKWRYDKFNQFIWNNIAETALSRQEREACLDSPETKLSSSARNLRLVEKEESGEIGEIVLYGIMKKYYNALPVVPKIFYKQNSQDFAKGADSVHILVHDNDFSLWLGEAKFYASIDNVRLNTIFESIRSLLTDDKLKKENRIITNLTDLEMYLRDKPHLLKKIKDTLHPNTSLDLIKCKLNIPILLLYEDKKINDFSSITEELKQHITKYHKDRAIYFFEKQYEKIKDIYNYNEVKFHIIIFPVPSKKDISDEFTRRTKFYKSI